MLAFAVYHDVNLMIEKFEFCEKGFVEDVGKLNSRKLRYNGAL
jgi:hypothetical protein